MNFHIAARILFFEDIMSENANEPLLTSGELSALPSCPVSPETLARWRSQGRGPRYVKLAGRVYYRESEFLAWLEKGEVVPELS